MTTDRECECDAGYRGNAHTNPHTCTACTPDVDFQPNQGETGCITVTPCVANAVTKTAGTIRTDRVCECGAGFFSAAGKAENPTSCAGSPPRSKKTPLVQWRSVALHS